MFQTALAKRKKLEERKISALITKIDQAQKGSGLQGPLETWLKVKAGPAM